MVVFDDGDSIPGSRMDAPMKGNGFTKATGGRKLNNDEIKKGRTVNRVILGSVQKTV